ncbi:MAG: 3D domain-containing protein [Chloroflexota bacterium]
MRDYIRVSRFLAAILLAVLAWTELPVSAIQADDPAEASLYANRPTTVTSRGGPRPAPTPAQARDILATRPQVLTPTPIPTPTLQPPTPTPTPQILVRSLGQFKVTGYSDSPLNGTDGRGVTASGVKTHWGAVAVDPRVIPLGAQLRIDGMGDTVFKALDTGGGVIGRWVDVWFESDWLAIQHGVRYLDIYLVVK